MVSSDIKAGDRVRLTVEGVVFFPPGNRPWLRFETAEGAQEYRIPFDEPGATVERLARAVAAGRLYRDNEGDVGLVREVDGQLWMFWVKSSGDLPVNKLATECWPLTQVWPPLDDEPEPGAPAEPLHTWPPDRPGLWYRDRRNVPWMSSVLSGGHIAVSVPVAGVAPGTGGRADYQYVDDNWGPMTPTPAPGGAS